MVGWRGVSQALYLWESGLTAGYPVQWKALLCVVCVRVGCSWRSMCLASPPIAAVVRTPVYSTVRWQDRAETLSTVAVLELLAGLLDFTTQCYPERLDNVDGVLSSAVTALTAQLSKWVPRCPSLSPPPPTTTTTPILPLGPIGVSPLRCCCCCCCWVRPLPKCRGMLWRGLCLAVGVAPSMFLIVNLGWCVCVCWSYRGALTEDAAAVVVRLLTLPQEKLAIRVLNLPNYPLLMSKLGFRDRRY